MNQLRCRAILFATALGAVNLLCSWPLQAQPGGGSAVKWQVFESAEGRFRIAFPGTPIRKQGKLATEIGDVISIRHSAGDGAEATYDVTYNDYPKAGIARLSPAKLLNAARDGLVYQAKGRVLSEKPFMIGKVAGHDQSILAADGTHYRIRLLLVESRLYQLTAMAKPPARTDEQRFFGSFQLTGVTPP
jgi:hypothetical protein